MYFWVIWSRPKTGDRQYWSRMPYSARSFLEAKRLLAMCQDNNGDRFDYEMHTAGRFGSRPRGTAVADQGGRD